MVTKEPTHFKTPVLKYKKTPYPQSQNSTLPRQYFVLAAIGPRGSGKTYSITQLIKAYEDSPPINPDGTKQDIRVFVISPTVDQQDSFKALKSIDPGDVYRSYKPSILEDILESMNHEKQETLQYKRDLELFQKFSKIRTLNQLTSDELMELNMRDFEPPEKPKYPNGVSNIICIDDMIGSELYRNGHNPFMTLLLRNRHLSTNIILCSQSMKGIPKTIRGNISCWMVFKFGQKTILQDLYEEAGADVSEKTFFELFDEATNDAHNYLVIDFSKPKSERFGQSFKYFLKPD